MSGFVYFTVAVLFVIISDQIPDAAAANDLRHHSMIVSFPSHHIYIWIQQENAAVKVNYHYYYLAHDTSYFWSS